jgi:hypothetical protein
MGTAREYSELYKAKLPAKKKKVLKVTALLVVETGLHHNRDQLTHRKSRT